MKQPNVNAPHVIASGNPFDGLTLIGPFENFAVAVEYAEQHLSEVGPEYWAVECEEPSDE